MEDPVPSEAHAPTDAPEAAEVPEEEKRKFRWEREVRGRELVVIPREEWGGPPILECEYWERDTLHTPVDKVILTYTESDYCAGHKECKPLLQRLHLEAVEQGKWTVPYNFVVGGDGTVYEARGWRRKPERNEVYPHFWGESVEIAHFGRKGKPPPINQVNGSWLLTLFGVKRHYFTRKVMPDRYQLFA